MNVTVPTMFCHAITTACLAFAFLITLFFLRQKGHLSSEANLYFSSSFFVVIILCTTLKVNCLSLLEIRNNLARECRFGNDTQVKPCQSGLRTGWVTNREYRLKATYVILSFLLLLFCVLCGLIVNSVLKSRFSIISASGF